MSHNFAEQLIRSHFFAYFGINDFFNGNLTVSEEELCPKKTPDNDKRRFYFQFPIFPKKGNDSAMGWERGGHSFAAERSYSSSQTRNFVMMWRALRNTSTCTFVFRIHFLYCCHTSIIPLFPTHAILLIFIVILHIFLLHMYSRV